MLPLTAISSVLLATNFPNTVQSQGFLCASDGSSASYTEQLITINDNIVREITASGCPNHPHPKLGANYAYDQSKDLRIPATPCISSEAPFDVSTTGGAIGITFNGVSIFTAWTGNPNDPDAIASEAVGFDGCSGHPTATGNYHYHMSPGCLLHQLQDAEEVNTIKHDGSTAHSPQIGWAYDGFPVYGPHGTDGYYTYPCTHPDTNDTECLDTCNGHTHTVSSGFLYHYHIAGPIGDLVAARRPSSIHPASNMYPYTIGCLVGVPHRWSLVNAFGHSSTCATDIEAVVEGYIPTVMEGSADPYTPWLLPYGAVCSLDEQCTSDYCAVNGRCRLRVNAQYNDEQTLQDDLVTMDNGYGPGFVHSLEGVWLVLDAALLMCVFMAVFVCILKRKQQRNGERVYSEDIEMCDEMDDDGLLDTTGLQSDSI